jgi:uncharacterized RDD family membrane protein YckC
VPPIAAGLAIAGTPRRLIAYLVDALIVSLLAYLVDVAAVVAIGRSTAQAQTITNGVLTIAFVVIGLAYSIWGWRSSRRGTPGMRLFKLQVGNAFDGRRLTVEQALSRWFVLGDIVGLLYLSPALVGLGSLISIAIPLVLLVTTVASPTKQGLHDRFARSVVVEPAGIGRGGVLGCIVLLVLVVVVLPVLAVIGLLALGAQVSTILSSAGSPAP